ncbi:MAG: TonB-dependent receptor [Opitutus sp.]|nr:TonB-dependent receptor [Opitutus sp.]
MTPLQSYRFSRRILAGLHRLGLAAALAIVPATAAATGTIAGTVSNAATGNLLGGARIEIRSLGLETITDATGRFVFNDVPAGPHELAATYLGLDEQRHPIVVAAGARATRDFDLTTAIYRMQAFTVAGEREGAAAAITAQRNSDNLKNVLAMDSFGHLPNMAASEVALRLPGVAGNFSDEDNVIGFTIRGIGPGLNTITVDGALLSSQGGMTRQTRIHEFTGSMFEQVELTKGHRPDQGADSLAATINLKSRSPLSMREKRRLTYSATMRTAPSFSQQIPLREEHHSHPLLQAGYQEVFDVAGGNRNLGVAANLFYSENATGYFSVDRDFQSIPTGPAFLWDYRTQDQYNNRKQQSVGVKTDYRLSSTTKVSLNLIYNDAFQKQLQHFVVRAFTNQVIGTTGTAGILPGFTDRITEVRPVAASRIDVTTRTQHFLNRLRHADLGVEHQSGRFEIDGNAFYSGTHINSGGGDAGQLINTITGVGWILDRTKSDLYPRVIQTGGPDFTNPANYRPTAFSLGDLHQDHEIREARANARYHVPVAQPLFLKTGFRWREEMTRDTNLGRQWTYLGTTALPDTPGTETFAAHKTGFNVPQWRAGTVAVGRAPVVPALWREDLYFRERIKFSNTRTITETVTAGYAMAQGRIAHTSFLTGVRVERTEDDSSGWVRARSASTAAQQLADPVGSAQRDYANSARELRGSYTKSFPSVHLTHDLTPALKARLSWSTSFGRPSMANLAPNESPNESTQILTINNPSLRPQSAKNWDASLDYYFEPVGSLSVGWFHKTIRDYIVTGIDSGTVAPGRDNGYDGEYAGFAIRTSSNAGTAVVQGWEFSYQQQFTFLPGLLRGLGFMANYTVIDTHGDFGGSAYRKSGEIPGFRPRSGNVGLSWTHRRFSARVLVNTTSDYINSFDAVSPWRNLYVVHRSIYNVGFAYQLRPSVTLTGDVANLFNEPQAVYRGIPDRMQRTSINGTTVTLGVSGRL